VAEAAGRWLPATAVSAASEGIERSGRRLRREARPRGDGELAPEVWKTPVVVAGLGVGTEANNWLRLQTVPRRLVGGGVPCCGLLSFFLGTGRRRSNADSRARRRRLPTFQRLRLFARDFPTAGGLAFREALAPGGPTFPSALGRPAEAPATLAIQMAAALGPCFRCQLRGASALVFLVPHPRRLVFHHDVCSWRDRSGPQRLTGGLERSSKEEPARQKWRPESPIGTHSRCFKL
jgi:hypothetical protein